MTIAEQLNHDFKSKGPLRLYDSNNNEIYYENSNGGWYKSEYDANNNEIYYEDSNWYWSKQKFDSNKNRIYYENSYGELIDNRPKPSCQGKVVEIDGKKYQLKELD